MKFGKTTPFFFNFLAEAIIPYFPDLKNDLKKAGIPLSVQDFLTKGIFFTFLSFIIALPIFSVVLTFFLQNFLFGFLSAITASFFLLAIFFIVYVNYPKIVVGQKAKAIDNQISFAAVHLATIASTKLPLDKVFEIFSKFSAYGEITKEIAKIDGDIKMFGLDVNTALQRAVERSPSKSLKELLWGIFSTNITGGDIGTYLNEKAKSFMLDYRTKLRDFAHSLSVYIEIYITAVVLGAIFLVILTSIVAGITGVDPQIIYLQFLMIFIFIPVVSMVFIYLIGLARPGGD